MYIYINGEYVLEAEAKISPFDHGFLYGLGVFETFRIYDGHPFLLDDHFLRLAHSLKQLNIYLPFSKKELVIILSELLHKNNHLKNAYIRLNVSAGNAPIGLQTEMYEHPNVIIFVKPILAPFSKEKKAVILQTARNTPEGPERLKSHHYLNNVLGKREVPSVDTEGIFLTKDGFIAEGVVSNIFWVKSGKVYTSSIETGILNGITRQFIFKMLKKHKISYVEGVYPLEEMLSADEVFISNSIQEIVRITKINDHLMTEQSTITSFLQRMYNHYTNERLWSGNEIEERV